MKTQIQAARYKPTGEIIYSRANHDFKSTKDEKSAIDGGQTSGYYRIIGDNLEPIVIELNATLADLYNDWNSRDEQHGYLSVDFQKKLAKQKRFRVVPREEIIQSGTPEWRKNTLMWKTYGKNGDEPGRMIMLKEAETSHLQAILDTQTHISAETREIIQSILKDRK